MKKGADKSAQKRNKAMGIITTSFLVTAFLVCTVLFLLFKKYGSKPNPMNSSGYWISAILLTPILYAGMLYLWLSASSSYEKQAFDQAKWLENTDSRYIFADDLIENEKLIGLSGSELESMLGKADHKNDSLMQFYIGYSPETFLNMDPDWLIIDLIDGEADKVYIQE